MLLPPGAVGDEARGAGTRPRAWWEKQPKSSCRKWGAVLETTTAWSTCSWEKPDPKAMCCMIAFL